MDSKNRVTSHLSGLFYRTLNLIENNIQPVYVFDGIPSILKQRTISARIKKREEALEAWNKAKEEGMIDNARAYAVASTRINKEIVESSKELLGYMGIPFIQAPGEGEAQSAVMTKTGVAYVSASQDYDSFLFGAVNVIRNLTISGRRKLPRKNVFINVEPELSRTEDLLKKLEINQLQLIMLGALVGTDFNTGIEKVGPKTALKLVKENPTPQKIESIVKEKYKIEFDVPLEEIINVFKKPDVKEITQNEFDELVKKAKPQEEKLLKFLSDEHEFSQERISSGIKKLLESRNLGNQKGINSWL